MPIRPCRTGKCRKNNGPRKDAVEFKSRRADCWIAKAIEPLRTNHNKPLRVAGLARQLGMSVSGLHHHFKAATGMSPLQFQKQFRLQEARRLLIAGDVDAATAGYRVGYDDASHSAGSTGGSSASRPCATPSGCAASARTRGGVMLDRAWAVPSRPPKGNPKRSSAPGGENWASESDWGAEGWEAPEAGLEPATR